MIQSELFKIDGFKSFLKSRIKKYDHYLNDAYLDYVNGKADIVLSNFKDDLERLKINDNQKRCLIDRAEEELLNYLLFDDTDDEFCFETNRFTHTTSFCVCFCLLRI